MAYQNSRTSWDTNIKHYVRNGLIHNLPLDLQNRIPRTNKHRWLNESDDKYVNCEVATFVNQEIEFLKKVGEYKNAKKVAEAYIKLTETYQDILKNVKGIQTEIAKQKEGVVNAIENIKTFIPVDDALKVFNISRATYHNYKTLVINKCDASYFLWCVKNYPHQLLKKEILKIKEYMENEDYKYWSKASIYLLALRNKDISICLTTWYKYSKLLGYKTRHLRPKIKYSSLISYKPNEIWCADVTILKTTDGKKHYIHFLMDHYSKKILGYSIENSSSPRAIKNLLQEAYLKYKNMKPTNFITDGGIENVNTTVKDFLKTTDDDIKHLIAQKDIPFSNSKIEAFNKIIKHQFLLPQNLENRKQINLALENDVTTYNGVRPQLSLQGNTPDETFAGKTIDIKTYKTHFEEQKTIRLTQNQQNGCTICMN